MWVNVLGKSTSYSFYADGVEMHEKTSKSQYTPQLLREGYDLYRLHSKTRMLAITATHTSGDPPGFGILSHYIWTEIGKFRWRCYIGARTDQFLQSWTHPDYDDGGWTSPQHSKYSGPFLGRGSGSFVWVTTDVPIQTVYCRAYFGKHCPSKNI